MKLTLMTAILFFSFQSFASTLIIKQAEIKSGRPTQTVIAEGKITSAGLYPHGFEISISEFETCQIRLAVLKKLGIDPVNLARVAIKEDAKITCVYSNGAPQNEHGLFIEF